MRKLALVAVVLSLSAIPARAEVTMDPLDDRGRVVIDLPGHRGNDSNATVEERLDQLRSLSTAHCMPGWSLERRSTGRVCVEQRRINPGLGR